MYSKYRIINFCKIEELTEKETVGTIMQLIDVEIEHIQKEGINPTT